MSEKLDRYFIRTLRHVHRVQNNMLILVTRYRDRLKLTPNECRKLMHNVMNHDRSKFSIEQFEPYIELTEYYHQKKVKGNMDYKYPNGVKGLVDLAIEHHHASENHHPEMFKRGDLGKWDRENAIECVCDLQAMAQEFGDDTCRKYYIDVWYPKYAKNSWFYDDYNWYEIEVWMNEAISCFENEAIFKGNIQ